MFRPDAAGHVHGPDCTWHPEPRCTRTRHRIARDGIPPRQTRELPVLLWPFELTARIEAWLRRRYLKDPVSAAARQVTWGLDYIRRAYGPRDRP